MPIESIPAGFELTRRGYVKTWRVIPSWPGYEVSEDGDVRRVGKANGAKLGRIRRPQMSRGGYLRVTMSVDGSVSLRGIHILVAEAFIGPRPLGLFVLHNDGHPANNHFTNLRYGTPKQNSEDMVAHGRSNFGERRNDMGLDITAYRKLTKLDAVFNANGEPIDPETREPLDWHDYAQFYVNDDFPGRNGSIEHKGVYSYEDSRGFRAGSYSGYNGWRERLAELAGYPTVEHERVAGYAPSRQMRRDAAAWHGLCEGMPFVELVNFSDCEGVIGPEASAKLANDFAAFDERAKVVDDAWFYDRYREWRKAFEMAADGGAVSFH